MTIAKFFSDRGLAKLKDVYSEMTIEVTEDLFFKAFDATFDSESSALEHVLEYGASLEFSGDLFRDGAPRHIAFKVPDFQWVEIA